MKQETEPFAWGLISSLYYLLFIAIVFAQLSCRTLPPQTAGALRTSSTMSFAAEVHAVCSDRTKGNGSGVFVGGEIVMTAWHVVDCGPGKVLHVTVKANNETYIADVVHEWQHRDVAKLRVYGLPPRAPVAIANIGLEERLCSSSVYPYLRSVCGPVYTIYDTTCPKLEWCHNANYLGDGPVIPGNSGSAVYNTRGALVGLVTGGTPVGIPNPVASITRLWDLREDLQ